MENSIGWFAAAMGVISDLPFFWPAALLGLAGAVALSVLLAVALRTSAVTVFGLLASAGLITVATLTPASTSYFVGGDCVLDQVTLPSLSDLLSPNETSLNVVLFVPLGIACTLLRRWPSVAVAALVSAGYPIMIELAQHQLAGLGRVCSSADVVNNLTGLIIGLAVGVAVLRPLVLPLLRAHRRSCPRAEVGQPAALTYRCWL
jgi:hypothetical protein